MMNLSQVKYQPERSRTYLGSPSLVRLPDGVLVVSHDYYGAGCPRNHEGEESLTSIYRSEDNGVSWENVTHIMNCYWSTLFYHNGALYIFGVTQQYGSIVIRRSDDGGFTWTNPRDDKSGWLFTGGYYHDGPNYHCAPVAVTVHEGRIYKAFEDCTPCVWGSGFQACVVSAPVDADLLDATSWTMSNKIAFDPSWVPTEWGEAVKPGWREGNVVADPDGALWDVLAFSAGPLEPEKAARISVQNEGKAIAFDFRSGFFDLPGAKGKFTLRYDPVSGQYLTFTNAIDDMDILRRMASEEGRSIGQRNNAYMLASEDLWTWRRIHKVLSDDTGLRPEDSVRLTGHQYVDWQLDGEDIIFVVRSAYRGAVNFHDANRIFFGTVPKFRQMLGQPKGE